MKEKKNMCLICIKLKKNKDSFWQFKYVNFLFEVKVFNIKNYDMFMILGYELIELKNKIIFLIDFGKFLLFFNCFFIGIKVIFKFLKYFEVLICKYNMWF